MRLILLLIITISPTLCFSQRFYVNCEDNKSKSIIENKIAELGYQLTDDSTESNYIVKCTIRQTSKINSMYKGAVTVVDTKTHSKIATTKEVRRGAVAVNGFNASANIFEVISKKYLPATLAKCK